MVAYKRFFGLRIKHLRETKDWTQEYLAEQMDISTNYLSSIERGKENPTFDLLVKLSKALEVEMWEMFDFGHEKSQKELQKALAEFYNNMDEESLRLAVRILRAIIR